LIENTDAMNDDRINKVIIIMGCQNIILVNINNSPAKLIEGGAEMLIAKKMNHQNIRLGKIFVSPLMAIIFRV